jgi:ADP-heptose:LPS heptosyltransferase
MPQRIGILRVGSLGDHLIALPLYRQLRELHAQDRLVLVSNLPAEGHPKLVGPASVLPGGLFDEYLNYPVGSDWRSSLHKYALFRRSRLDLLYYLMPLRTPRQLARDGLFFRLLVLPVVGLTSEVAAAPLRYLESNGRYEHEAERLARGIPALKEGLRNTSESRSMALTDSERLEARALLGTDAGCTVTVSIGTKCEVNDWGLPNWSELVTRLAQRTAIERLVLIGSGDEFGYSEQIKAVWPRSATNFCGRLSPRLSAAVLAQTQLFVGHDSGPMHMAAAVNVPIVAVFSSRNPRGQWFPLSQNARVHYTDIECMGCGRIRCEDRHQECIRRITVQQVYESCLAALPVDIGRI